MEVCFIDKLIIPSLNTAWLAGFTDAEKKNCKFFPCFYSRVKSCLTSKLKRAPHLTYQITQKEFYIIKTIKLLFLEDSGSLKNITYDKS